MTHHNSHVRTSTHGGRAGRDKWRGAGRPGRNVRNRSTGTRNIPFHTPSFRPFALFTPLDDQQDEDDAFAAGDNRMSTVRATTRARWRGFRFGRPRLLHSPDGDRGSILPVLLPPRIGWERQRGLFDNLPIWQQWGQTLGHGMDMRTPPVPSRRLLRDRRLLFLNRPSHPVNSIATLEFPMRRRRSGSNTFSQETLSVH